MTEPGPPNDPFAPPPPGAWGTPPQPSPPPPWAHAQLQQPAYAWPQNAWQQSPPWYSPPPAKGTSALAVAALVTSVFALVPVALGLSIAALARMKRRDQKGLGLVYGALSVCSAWALLIVIAIVIGVAGGYDSHSRGSIAEVASSKVGSCLHEDPPSVEDCSTAHDLEVYFAPTMPDAVWPGATDLADTADRVCHGAFESYVGTSYDSSALDYDFYAPTRSEWAGGKRQVACVVTPADQYLVGSVRGTGR